MQVTTDSSLSDDEESEDPLSEQTKRKVRAESEPIPLKKAYKKTSPRHVRGAKEYVDYSFLRKQNNKLHLIEPC